MKKIGGSRTKKAGKSPNKQLVCMKGKGEGFVTKSNRG